MPMLSMGHWAWKKLVVILLFVSYVEVCVLLLDRVLGKPRVPAGFWVSGDMCDALCLPSLGLPGPLTVVKDRDSSVSGLAELLRFFLPADKMIHSFIYSCVWKDHYGTTCLWSTEHLLPWNLQPSGVGEANRHQSKSKAERWNENLHKCYKGNRHDTENGGLMGERSQLYLFLHTLWCFLTVAPIKRWNLFP